MAGIGEWLLWFFAGSGVVAWTFLLCAVWVGSRLRLKDWPTQDKESVDGKEG